MKNIPTYPLGKLGVQVTANESFSKDGLVIIHVHATLMKRDRSYLDTSVTSRSYDQDLHCFHGASEFICIN